MPSATSTSRPSAPIVIGPTTKSATRPTVPLPSYLIEEGRLKEKVTFDAASHLAFEPPANVVSMNDIGLDGQGISQTAVSDPFPLFTQSAIQQIRAEVFSENVLKDCQFSSTFSRYMIRGMGPAYGTLFPTTPQSHRY